RGPPAAAPHRRPAARAAQHEHHVRGPPQPDPVQVLQPLARDTLAVEEGAVRALEVLDPPPLAVPVDAGVLARDTLEREGDRRRALAAEDDTRGTHVEPRGPPLAQPGADLGLHWRRSGRGGLRRGRAPLPPPRARGGR